MDPDLADLTTAGNFIHATVFWAKTYFYIILYYIQKDMDSIQAGSSLNL